MVAPPDAAVALLHAGVLLGVALLARIAVVRNLPVEVIPAVLRDRVELGNRLCPWLLAAAVAMVGAGLLLHLLY